jgi:acyl carrier protein
MEMISDSQALIWFMYASAIIYLVIFIPMRLAKLSKEQADKKHNQVTSLAVSMTELDTRSLEEKTDDLMKFLAAYFEISPKKLTPDASFLDDLRIPSSELDQCFDDIQESFEIMIDHSKIHKVRDLLELLK